MTNYERLYKYCTTARVHGSIYKKKLKELQQLNIKALRKSFKSVKFKNTNTTEVFIDD